MKNIVVLHSGGMDSTTLLWELHALGHDVTSLGVFYGQRHEREVLAADTLAARLSVERIVVDLPQLREIMPGSALTDDVVDVPEGHYADASMRATVVPNRNMVLLALAGAVAVSRRADAVAYAAHAGDHTIYPDCRPPFVAAMRTALSVCDYKSVDLLTPYITIDKREIAERGQSFAVPWELTWTCYKGGEQHCGVCGACAERREALAPVGDPTKYERR